MRRGQIPLWMVASLFVVLPPLLVSQPVSRPRSVGVASASILALTDDAEVRDLLMELALHEGWGVRCAPSEAEQYKREVAEPATR